MFPAAQRIRGRIGAGKWIGVGRRRAAEKEVLEHVDRIREFDDAVIVAVGAVLTSELHLLVQEKVGQHLHGVREVHLAVRIRVSPDEVPSLSGLDPGLEGLSKLNRGVVEQGDVDFTVALIDRSGTTSRVSLSAYEAGIVEPYRRWGPDSAVSVCGREQCCSPVGCNPSLTDFGWQAEFETVRIRLTDFLTGGTGLDLSDVVEVRFEFGSPGSAYGRLLIDDVMVTPR